MKEKDESYVHSVVEDGVVIMRRPLYPRGVYRFLTHEEANKDEESKMRWVKVFKDGTCAPINPNGIS